MKVNELRINNFVNEEVLGDCPVCRIDEDSVWLDAKNMTKNNTIQLVSYHIGINNITPILLTEEWLEKFGFKKIVGIYTLTVAPETQSFFEMRILKHGYFFWLSDIWVNLPYVHSLQNLFFALTNQELELTNEQP